MATRSITIACLANSSRNGVLSFRFGTRFITHQSAVYSRQLQTTSIRREQKADRQVKRDIVPKIVRGASKFFKNADAAVADLKSGSTVLSAGFGLCGTAGEEDTFYALV